MYFRIIAHPSLYFNVALLAGDLNIDQISLLCIIERSNTVASMGKFSFLQSLRLIFKLHGACARTSITKGWPLHKRHTLHPLPACTARLKLASIQDTEPYLPSRLVGLKQSLETKKKVQVSIASFSDCMTNGGSYWVPCWLYTETIDLFGTSVSLLNACEREVLT